MTPYCPKCGSIKVQAKGQRGKCLEPDCLHEGSAKTFREHTGTNHQPNQHWRDPVAMLPGGYE